MKTRYVIVFINIGLLGAGWMMLGILGKNYADKLYDESVLVTAYALIDYIAKTFNYIFFGLALLSLLGTILFIFLKKKEFIIGFLINLLLNLAVIAATYVFYFNN